MNCLKRFSCKKFVSYWVLMVGAMFGISPIQAQFCGTGSVSRSFTNLDLNQDGFDDVRLKYESTTDLQYGGQMIGCVSIQTAQVSLIPLGLSEVFGFTEGNTRLAIPLLSGVPVDSGLAGGNWSNIEALLYRRQTTLISNQATTTTNGPLALSPETSLNFGVRVVSHDGLHHGWVRFSTTDARLLASGIQSLPNQSLPVGDPPTPISGNIVRRSRPVDTDGDGIADLFVVRRTQLDPVTQVEETEVTLLDQGSGEVLVGDGGQPGWPEGKYLVALEPGKLVRNAVAPFLQWVNETEAKALWGRRSVNGVETLRWGPCSQPGGASVAFRRLNGLLVILDLSESGELISTDSSQNGVIAAGIRRITKDLSNVTAVEYLDLDRDATADVVVVTTSDSNPAPGSTSITTRVSLHAVGSNRLGTAFGPGREYDPVPPVVGGANIEVIFSGLSFSQIPPTPFQTVVSADHYLPVYLKRSEGYRVGWLNVDATASPMRWRAGLAEDSLVGLRAGDAPLLGRLESAVRKKGSAWLVELQWSEFSTPVKVQFASALDDIFQTASFLSAVENVSTNRGDGWVDRKVSLPLTAAQRYYRLKY